MAKASSRRLVIDADIARAAGGPEAVHPRAMHCRDFLIAVLEICHRLVTTADILAEWRDHGSRFTRKWLVQMHARKKVEPLGAVDSEQIVNRIKELQCTEAAREVMIKDVHLLAAAFKADRVVVSLDETVRALYSAASDSIAAMRPIVWVNPDLTHEIALMWLADGAKADPARQLGHKASPIE